MKVELVRIGNSRGIRIPKPIIDQCGFGDRVELRVENECLVIAPDRRARQGWEEGFQAAGPAHDDELLLEAVPANEFDGADWQW
ncbi:MAG: AbrB/MazE/SpoVT family DNA-binding domain-containing protein [Bryobacteraceae bacterium]|jgi:antitoxin MazE